MPTLKFVLQKPYKDRKAHSTTPITAGDQGVLNGTKNGTKTKRQLNTFETRLYACLIIDRHQMIKIKTEHVVYPAHWNFDRQMKKDNIAGSVEFNRNLFELKNKILTEYNRIIKEDFPPDTDIPFTELRTRLIEHGRTLEKRTVKKTVDFFQILDEYIDYLEGEVAEGTRKKYITLKNSLLKFSEGNEQITFAGINHKFLDAYTKYLRTQEPRGRQRSRPENKQKGLLNDTTGKYIETIKTFLSWAEERKYNKFTTYKSFSNFSKANRKRKKQTHDIVTLTLPELKQLYEFDFSNDACLDRVRDVFCFECFTGQRWSDIDHFDKSQLHGDIWRFTADKTKKEIEIDMTGYSAPALDILKKYDYQLPMITNQKFNLFLKRAVKEVGIVAPETQRRYVGAEEIKITKPKHEFISSHTARRTCVSILLNDYNMNPIHVMEITAHSDLKTLQKYIKPDRQARREAMSKTKPITELMKVVHKTG